MKITREGALLRIVLDRAEDRNRLTTEDCAQLAAAVNDAEAGAVLIESTGPVFCGGLVRGADAGNLWAAETWRRCPVVAAVQGPAVDEGVALIGCAHIVVAAQGASFALTSIRNGVFPAAAHAVLARAIGERRALEVALTGRVFTVQDAVVWGLVHIAAPAFEFDDRAEGIALALAEHRIGASHHINAT